MEITDIRIKLVNQSTDRLKAFCTVTLDGEFVIRDIKLVEGSSGLFVAMPSRKLSAPCPKCRHKNRLRARFCNECGTDLPSQEVPTDDAGRARLYRDIAHPITASFREKLQAQVVGAYESEEEQASHPDYQPVGEDELTSPGASDIAGECSEYDTIIAELNTPTASTDGNGVDSKADDARRTQTAPERPSAGRRRGRGRGDRGRGREPTADQKTGERTPQPTATQRMPIAQDDETSRPLKDAESKPEPYVGAPPPVQTPQRQADKVSLAEAAEETPVSEDPGEDTAPFGAGIV